MKTSKIWLAALLSAAPAFTTPVFAAEPRKDAPKHLTTAEVLASSTP